MKIKVFQIYYNSETKSHLQSGFEPYNNQGKESPLFESGVIYDLWKNRKKEWEGLDYVGVVSWRFKEKTNLDLKLITDHISQDKNKKDIYFMTPPKFWKYKHVLSNEGHGNIINIAKIADKEKLFPFNIFKYDIGGYICFCNYFVCTPKVFDRYCREYLEPSIKWMQERKTAELKEAIQRTFPHRNKNYPLQPFFLEGLFNDINLILS